jgi:hypothetical protein
MIYNPSQFKQKVTGHRDDIVKVKRSYTGAFLAAVLARREPKRKARTEAAE